MSEFSRRVNVQVFKDEPMSRQEFGACFQNSADDATVDRRYDKYLDRFQPYRWHARAANGEIVAFGERYFNEADCINAIELNYGDDTTVWRMPDYGEDRGETWLRYGATDRAHQAPQS